MYFEGAESLCGIDNMPKLVHGAFVLRMKGREQ
jgi:hypothetical protein